MEHFLVFCGLAKTVTIEDVRWVVATTQADFYNDADKVVLPIFDDKRCRCPYEEPFATAMGLEHVDEECVPHFWAHEIGLDDYGPSAPMDATSCVIIHRGTESTRTWKVPTNNLSKWSNLQINTPVIVAVFLRPIINYHLQLACFTIT